MDRHFVRLGSLLLAFAVAACGGGGGSPPAATQPPPVSHAYTDGNLYSADSGASLATPNEITAVSQQQLTLGGQALNYTATVGHLTALGLGTNAPQASFFYVAYTLDGAAPSTRPVTFFYNGGPGSATVWLHLGSFGPRRLSTGVPAMTQPAPFPLVDNAESLLDVSDLVFVDAVGTGYSEAIAPNINRNFWGVDADAAVFRDFVMRYDAVNNRAASPKFLFGESYGGPRTAVLARALETAGVELKGVILQSPAMDYNTNCDVGGGIPCTGFVPSYGATGAWFQRTTPAHPPAEIPGFMAQMRLFALHQYDPAVRAGTMPDELAAQLQAHTGITAAQWRATPSLRPSPFRVSLMPGLVLGRYDARVTLPSANADASTDPSSLLIGNSFGLRINEYLGSLGYTTPSGYVMLGNAVQNWNFSHAGRPLPDTIPDLAAAMALNPGLRVLALNGYHDLATPFFVTETDVARLGTFPQVQVNNYLGGHMTYLDDGSRALQKADLAAFYGRALGH